MDKLERQVAELQAMNAKLNAQVVALSRENDSLRQTRIIPNFTATSSEEEEARSSPSSPSSQDSQNSPRLSYSNPHPVYAANLARTGVLLFALVFSVGMFYNMMELDIQRQTAVTQPQFRSRALSSVDETMTPANQNSNGSNKNNVMMSPIALPAIAGPQTEKMEVDGESKTSQTAKPLPFIKPLSSVNNTGSLVALSSRDLQKLALALKLPDTEEGKTVTADNSNKAVDIWHEPAQQDTNDQFAAMKDILIKANMTMDDATYMFCPSAVQIRPTKAKSGSGHSYNDSKDSRSVFARKLVDRLPRPNMSDADHAEEDRSILSPRNNRLLLWVPTSSVVAGGAWDPSLIEEPHGFKLTGLSELEIRISGIRPVLVARPGKM
jgi:hypothetical protein